MSVLYYVLELHIHLNYDIFEAKGKVIASENEKKQYFSIIINYSRWLKKDLKSGMVFFKS